MSNDNDKTVFGGKLPTPPSNAPQRPAPSGDRTVIGGSLPVQPPRPAAPTPQALPPPAQNPFGQQTPVAPAPPPARIGATRRRLATLAGGRIWLLPELRRADWRCAFGARPRHAFLHFARTIAPRVLICPHGRSPISDTHELFFFSAPAFRIFIVWLFDDGFVELRADVFHLAL